MITAIVKSLVVDLDRVAADLETDRKTIGLARAKLVELDALVAELGAENARLRERLGVELPTNEADEGPKP